MRPLYKYLRDLCSHWVLLMSGSVVTVGTQAVSAIFNLSVPPWVFWPIGFVCFFVAGYRAWKKQYLARLSAETKRNLDAERRAELQEPLAEFTAKDRLLI